MIGIIGAMEEELRNVQAWCFTQGRSAERNAL